jgi:hypothetical protein
MRPSRRESSAPIALWTSNETKLSGHSDGLPLYGPGPFQIRSYADEKLEDLEPVYELVDSIVEQHQALIPGSMNRLMRQWREDLWRAIEDINTKDAEEDAAEETGKTDDLTPQTPASRPTVHVRHAGKTGPELQGSECADT